MQYTFICPLEGCHESILVDAENDTQALDAMVKQAKSHLTSVHPELHKTDDEIRVDIQPKMVKAV